MSKLVALWIDDADYIDDNSEEALEYMLKMFDRLGINVTFKIAGEKARTLKRHGRNDLITGMSRHEISFHTEYHTLHPTVIEYTDKLSFTEGVYEFEKREGKGIADVRDIFGKRIVGYGQPGEGWSPDVCPVMLKYGGDINLDDHFILNVEGQAFEYGGMYNYAGLRRIIRYDYHNENGLEKANAYFDSLAEQDFGWRYPENNKLFSVFYHPGEFYVAEFMSDVYNFREGKNWCFDDNGVFKGYNLPPVLPMETAHCYMDLVEKYLRHMLDSGAHFVTASELPSYVYRRSENICAGDVLNVAALLKDGNIGFADVNGEYVSASEAFILLSQYLNGKPLHTFLAYGPEKREKSILLSGETVKRSETATAMSEFETILGYPQLKSLYQVGRQQLTPLDLCATAAKMVSENLDECIPVSGTLESEKYVHGSPCWDGRWMFAKKFDVSNTYEKTKLQCWTLKPLRY